MPLPMLIEDEIKKAFESAGLPFLGQVSKIVVGFSHDIHAVDDKYIFKSARSAEEEHYYEKEAYVCNLLKGKIPAPVVVRLDTSHAVIDRPWVIYEKIEGENLYMVWHSYSVEERKEIVKQICSFLKIINAVPYEDFAKTFKIDIATAWRERIATRIREHIARAIEKNALSPELISKIEVFVEKGLPALDQSVIALTYFDTHFDNFLVRDKRIVGMLDFERTDVLSIDYALDVVKRMVEHPAKYASEMAKPLIKAEDYAHLMDWYKEFYPELFDFPNLDTRLALYAIEHDLENLYWWPESEDLKKEIEKNILL